MLIIFIRVEMHFNKYKDKLHQESSLSSSFINAPNDKTLIMAPKEKKENTRMGKQTATVYAAKIKTKIHNTSSFFKLSLKSNNKALALALVAQKQKSRELETEVVRLRKDAQSTHFDLAHQRHKNKQLFGIIQEFYDSSLNWMTKAVDIFSNDEDPDTMDSECNTSEDQIIEVGAVESLQDRPLCPQQNHVQSEPENSAGDAPSQERDSPVQQNTIYDSEMEMTISDSASEIVTVEINARRTSKVTDDHQEKDLCLSEIGTEVISAKEDSAIEFSRLEYTSAVSKEVTAVTQQCFSTVQSEVENGQQMESITARRKTHVTSRCSKSSRRTYKLKEPNPDPRKTYWISQDPPKDNFNDCFSDPDLQNSERSKAIPSHGNISNKAAKSKAKESHASRETRRTIVGQDELRSRKSRKTKVLSLMVDGSLLDMHQNVQSASTLCPEAACMDVGETTVQKNKNKTPAHTLPQSEKCKTQKNRGTFVIQTSQSLINRNSFLNVTNILEDPNRPEGLQEVISETQMAPLSIGSDNEAQQHKEPEHEFHEIMTENTHHPECSRDVNASFAQNPSKFMSSVAGKAKKHRKEAADKIKKKNAAPREKHKALKTNHNSAVSVGETVLTKRQDETDLQNGAGCRSLSNTLQLPVISHCSASKEDLGDEHNAESLEISSPLSVDKLDQTNHINVDSLNINSDQTNQALEGRCRKTYVVSSYESPLKEKTDSGASSDISEHDLFANETDNVSPVINRSMFVMEKYNVTSDGFSGSTKDLQFTEERPPWETLDGYTETLLDESSTHSPQPETCCQTMIIYQDQDSDLRHQAPEEGRVMKSLTNTERNSDCGRTRRRAAPVSYKEPPLNCKMRRGDKYSDTKFLNSPVFKDKRKKKRV